MLNQVRKLASYKKANPADKPTIQGDALRAMLYTALASAGAGMGFRGLTGALNAFKQPYPKDRLSKMPTIVDIPYPRRVQEDKEKQRLSLMKTSNYLWDLLTNPKATTQSEVPFIYPGLLLAGAGGAAMGYKGMDKFLKNRQENVLETDLAAARKRYHKALISQYLNPSLQKSSECEEEVEAGPDIDNDEAMPSDAQMEYYAGDDDFFDYYEDFDFDDIEDEDEKEAAYAEKIGSELDALYHEATEKKANNWFDKVWPHAMGAYLGIAAPAAVGSGILAYNYADKRDPKKMLDEAIEAREQEALVRRPREVFIRPVPIDVTDENREKKMRQALSKIKLPADL